MTKAENRMTGTEPSLCRRCHNEPADIVLRVEPLCRGCFCKYVATKVVKRMESFRVRHSTPGVKRELLLPLSYGCCSTALLYILSQHLRGQIEKTGRTGYHLHVLHIIDGESAGDDAMWQAVQERFPEHTYSRRQLSDVLALNSISTFFSQLGHAQHDATEVFDIERFDQLLASYKPATSRADVSQILRRRLISHHARQHHCEAILWGDSTTRLAERTLAETAKGRGFSLPYIVSDDEPALGIPSHHPLRDLLGKEVAAFPALSEPTFDELVIRNEPKPAVSTKNTTIDDLMRQYFASVENEYPSVVANVVKTATKLHTLSADELELAGRCELCDMPLDGEAPERSRLCYGCIRTLPIATG